MIHRIVTANAIASAWVLGIAALLLPPMVAATAGEPQAESSARHDASAGRPVTIFVSKLGDNTDGSSWQKAFRTVQAALSAVPNDQGGHRVIVRPDTYMEANLLPKYPGAKGAYNELVGDFDGSLGSGTTGHVILDAGEPRKGFKSYDWWGNIRAYQKGWSAEHTEETVSAILWDRWTLRRLYATGGDGGLCFDCTDRIEPFTVVVEDCISIGRAFGCGAMSCLSRSDEPITFRRCNMWSLDEWGDTAAGYVRIENKSMPKHHDIVFDDCIMVSPQCALKGGNYGFHTYSHVLVKNCTLVALNFSQPHGTPTDGVVQSVQNGKYFQIDFENCILMGYKVFGVKVDKDSVGDIAYSTKGSVLAYESNDPTYPAFTTKFARSDDLDSWSKLPDAAFGTNRYTACPCIRYVNGYYYVLYLETRQPAHVFETYVTRSKDLNVWELSSANPVLAPTGLDEGINASDADVVEIGGKTFVYFSVGDQRSWMNVKRGEFGGTLQQFFERWFAQPSIRDPGDMASHRARTGEAVGDSK